MPKTPPPDRHLLGILNDVRSTPAQRLHAVRILTALHLDRQGKKDLALAMLTGKLMNDVPEPFYPDKSPEVKVVPTPVVDSF